MYHIRQEELFSFEEMMKKVSYTVTTIGMHKH